MFRQLFSRLFSAPKQDDQIFNIIFNHSNDAIMIVDPMQGRIIKANPRACQLLDYSLEELLTIPISDVHPYDLDELMAFSGEVLQEGHGWTDRLTCVTSRGERLPSEISASVVDHNGERLMISMVRDISQRVAAEQALKVLNEHLEDEVRQRTASLEQAQEQLIASERLRAIGEFTSMIIHEIRNPLNAIELVFEYFHRQQLAEGADKRLVLGEGALQRLTHLLNEILLYAKPQKLNYQRVDLAALIQAEIRLLQDAASTKGRTIEVDIPESLATIDLDLDKIRQVLINLLSNACEAIGEQQRVTITVTDEGEQLLLTVINGGAPIAPEQLSKLTTPFFTTKANGTGLGLPIVAQIIAKHGGTLNIESTAQRGTVVKVMLPKDSAQRAD